MPNPTWAKRAQQKRDALKELIPNEWRIPMVTSHGEWPSIGDLVRAALTPEELEMTEVAPLSLLANVHAQVWAAEDVVRAFCHRAAVAHQFTNCLSEIMFNEAIASARSQDQHYKHYGTLCGPLHGLPMSFMDRYRVAGYETSAGFVAWLGVKETPQTEALIVRHMRRLGAIPFCKTNCPQSMLIAATDNNITGPTLNPFRRALSAGGAAGGEGVLQAVRGSPVGWVTEIAGSSRIPATFNKLFALRICHGRLSNAGIASTSESLPEYSSTPALMSWDLCVLQHVARMSVGSHFYLEDPYCIDFPWRESRWTQLHRSRPRFAIMHHDNQVYPQPPVQRALSLVKAALEAQQYDVVTWDPPEHTTAVQTYFRLLGADGGSSLRLLLDQSGEPPVKGLQQWYQQSDTIGQLSVEQFWSLSKEREQYRRSYCKYWQAKNAADSTHAKIEGIIMPVLANAATYEHGLSYFGYSAIVNFLDFTAISFPVTTVNESIDVWQFDRNMKCVQDAKVYADYDPHAFQDHPVGLQVMCRRLEEETCLKLAEIVTEALQEHDFQALTNRTRSEGIAL